MKYPVGRIRRIAIPILLLIISIWRAVSPWLPGIVSVFLMVAGGNEPPISLLKGTVLESLLYKLHINSPIVSGLGIGIFSGWAVWFFSVHLSEQRRKKIMRAHLTDAYKNFRERLMYIFLFGTQGGADVMLAEKLQDYREFKEFFDDEHWGCLFGWLGERDDYLLEIHQEIEILSNEAKYVRDKCNIEDVSVHDFLGRISNLALEYKQTNAKCTYEYRKTLLRFLWGMFSQWNIISGQYEKDPIQNMIDKIR